jgi:Tol biopolymer transport system component
VALAVGTRIDDYLVVSPLGAGGMGEVYRATDAKLGRDVALKVLPSALASDADRLARFDREAKLLASLNHSGIAHLYGFETAALEDGTRVPVLVMELVEGEDLAARLKRGAIAVDEALAIARQVAEALEEAHEKGIVHRDLKPGNIKVTPAGQVKVLDFGLAKAFSGDAANGDTGSSSDLSRSPTLARSGTEAGLILGTATYMSPEQARARPVDRRADIWAFGVVLFEMLSGNKLFDGETVTDVLAAVVREPIRWEALPAATPAPVRRLLARCLERDPRRRLRDIGEARLALEAGALADDLAGTLPAAPSSRLARGLPWAVAAAAVGLAAWGLSRTGAGTPAARKVIHLDIAFSPGVEPMGGRQGGIAIAPDGMTIAMVGFKDGQRRLFVRRLDAPDAVDLTGTSGGGVFSPDSASVAVVSNATAVTRVSLADGQQTTLATGGDFVSGVNLAWGAKDVFFVRNGSIWGVPAEGGTERQLTSLDAAKGEALHTDPLALPGGERLLFSRLTSEPGGDRIEAIPAQGGSRTVVVENATTPVWSPTGHLLFARGAAVWAMPFDPATATALGTAVPVIPAGVVGPVRAGSLGFEVSTNGTLVFVPANFDTKRFVSVGRDGSELPLPMPPGRYGNPRLSPDGRRVAIDRDGSRIELLDLERGTHAVVVPSGVGTNFVIWTSDGANLVFRRLNAAVWAAANGSGKTGRVPHGDANTSPASAGPDASSFIGIRLMPQTGGDLYLMSVTGAFPPRPIVETRAYEGSPHLSPDGRWLLYQSNASGQPEIFVRRYPAGDRAWQVSEGGGVQTRWSMTGREVFFRGGGRIMAVAFDGKGPEPVLGKPQGLFADVYDFGQGLSIPNYDVTRDGRFLMLRRSTEGGTLRVVLNWTEELKRTLAQGGAR